MGAAGTFERLDALSAAPAERLFFRQLALYEVMSRRSAVVQCALIHTAPEATARVVDYLQEHSGRMVKGLLGLLMWRVYQDRDERSRLFIMHGWESVDVFERYQAEGHSHLHAQLHALGARVEYFTGLPRGDVYRHSGQ
jgi:hypothetical protein